jgi:hypothetical protein
MISLDGFFYLLEQLLLEVPALSLFTMLTVLFDEFQHIFFFFGSHSSILGSGSFTQ